MAAMDYQQLVLENEALLAELPASLQQRAGSQLIRTLPQLRAESNRFVSRPSRRAVANGVGLAVAGVDRFDFSKERRALDKIDLSSAYEDFEPSTENNLERYLDYQQSLLVNTLIEENNGKIVQGFIDTYNMRLTQVWQTQKNRLLRNLTVHFSDSAPGRQIVAEPLSAAKLGPEPASSAVPRPITKELKYAEAVQEVLQSRGHCAQLFTKAISSFNEQTANKDTSIIELWRLVEEFAYATLKQRIAPASYSDLLKASVHFLEVQFQDWMSSHLDKARIGGTPGIANHIRAFIKAIVFKQRYPSFMKTEMVNEVPLWPQLFYCLRAGAVDEAADLATMATRIYPENSQLALLTTCIGNEHLTDDHLKALTLDYNSFVRNESDPFAVAVYNIVSGGALESYDNMKYRQNPEYRNLFRRYITPSHTDYLWFSMQLLKHGDFEGNLRQFQASIRGYEQHFSRNQTDPLLYFLVLLLSLQFPAAVVYLLTNSKFRVDGVHFAIALDELGLLLPRDLKEAEREIISADIESILREYVVDSVDAAVPVETSMKYLALVADRHPEIFDRLFVRLLTGNASPMDQIEVIRKLVNKDSGLARDYMTNDRVDKLCIEAANSAVSDQSYLVACQLYQFAEPQPQEHYASTLIRLLDIHILSLTSPVRQLALERARAALDSTDLSPRLRDALSSLVQLAMFFNANHAIRYDEALQDATFNSQTSTGFIPLLSADIQPALQQFDYINSVTNGVVSRVFPELATAIMKILFNKYEIIRNHREQLSRPQTLVAASRDIRDQAQALHSFYVKLESQGVVNSYSEAFSKYYRSMCE